MISVSLSAIVDGALARTALYRTLNPNTASTILCHDDAPALRRTARDVLARCAMSLAPMIKNCNIDTVDIESDDTIEFDLNIASSNEGIVRCLLESAATSGVLATAFVAVDPSQASDYMSKIEHYTSLILSLQQLNYNSHRRPYAA